MVDRYTREQVEARLRAAISVGSPIIVAGAGNGLSAKLEELGGIDLSLRSFTTAASFAWTGCRPYAV